MQVGDLHDRVVGRLRGHGHKGMVNRPGEREMNWVPGKEDGPPRDDVAETATHQPLRLFGPQLPGLRDQACCVLPVGTVCSAGPRGG